MGTQLQLEGELAVVVGASEGIGAEIAVGLAQSRADVVLAGRSLDRLGGTAATVQKLDGVSYVREVDVRDPSDVERFAEAVIATIGTPTILVNSAGGQLYRPALETTPEEWDNIHQTHLRGTFFSCRAFAPALRDKKYGKIINLSSTYSLVVVERRSAYASAKAGVSHLTAALALEWAPFGIRVNALAPGATRTPRVIERIESETDLEKRLAASIPLGRIAEPADIVGPALFLASPLSDYITGETLVVDGGWARSK